MMEIRRLDALPTAALAPLVEASAGEGFRFLARLCREWETGEARFDGPGEVLLGAYRGPVLVAVGGLTRDPYGGDPNVGRLRHLYVAPGARRQGTGASLVRALADAARTRFRALVLRTDTPDAARFYETLGYTPLPHGGTATHRRQLASSGLLGPLRIPADFNGLFGELLCLAHEDVVPDEQGELIRLRAGMNVTAFEPDPDIDGTPDELLADGVVEESPDWLTCNGSRWVLRIDSRGVRHRSDE